METVAHPSPVSVDRRPGYGRVSGASKAAGAVPRSPAHPAARPRRRRDAPLASRRYDRSEPMLARLPPWLARQLQRRLPRRLLAATEPVLVLVPPPGMAASALTLPMAARGRSLLRRPAGSNRPGRGFTADLKRRDRSALETLYHEYAPTVLGYLINTLGDRGAAEDVHQQVFLEVWQRAPTYDPDRASLLTWIMTIARSRAVDEQRRRRPEPQDPAGGLEAAVEEDPEQSPDALVERWRVAHLLSRLRADEAELLRMRFYEGLSQTEISERTDIRLGTVKMRMVAALRRLRDMIEEES
jgi:RNA polymerase sigma-70 factor (ECF subfamily)